MSLRRDGSKWTVFLLNIQRHFAVVKYLIIILLYIGQCMAKFFLLNIDKPFSYRIKFFQLFSISLTIAILYCKNKKNWTTISHWGNWSVQQFFCSSWKTPSEKKKVQWENNTRVCDERMSLVFQLCCDFLVDHYDIQSEWEKEMEPPGGNFLGRLHVKDLSHQLL